MPGHFTMSSEQNSMAMFLPAHNEADNLPKVVSAAVRYLEGRDANHTLIIVDDGSDDNTVGVVVELQELHSHVEAVRHGVNMGYGSALRSGFEAALCTGHSWIAFCDADGQFDPAEVDSLTCAAIDTQADAAIGYRIDRADGVRRRVMGRGWHHLSRATLGFAARDVDCGCKAFRRYVVERILPELIGTHATVSPEMLARIERHHFRTVEVGVQHYPRRAGEQSGASRDVVLKSFRTLYAVRKDLHRKVCESVVAGPASPIGG